MEQLVPLVRTYTVAEDPDHSNVPTEIAQGLAENRWKLIDIVKSLGDMLVSEEDATRARGVSLLAGVVAAMDRSTLDRQSTKTLTTFFVDKLGDKSSMVSCASALAALTESPAFGTGEGVELAKGLFAAIDLQSFPQASRFVVYQLVDALMLRCRPALKRLGREFVKGYSQMVEGEKDPRNLMLSFSLVRVILLEFDLTGSVEDLFDITFCYFPITFNPPKDDPYGITSEDLIGALRHCLSATPHFGKLALPLFLDKMQAASEKAKRQTLQTLVDCFPVYGAAVCGEWAGRFSEALSIEVFHATEANMMELALEALRALYSTLYPDNSPVSITSTTSHADNDGDAIMAEPEATTSKTIEGIAIKVVQNSLDELKEPDKSNAKPAVKILNALICSSSRLAAYVLSLAVPQLLALFKDPDEVLLRAPVLVCLADLLSSLSPADSPSPANSTAPADAPISFPPPTLLHADGASPLEPFRDDLLSVLTSGSRAPTSRAAALDGLVRLVRVPNFLSSAEVTYCVSAIDDVLIGAADADASSSFTEDDYENALDGLVSIASIHPRTIEHATLPKLFERLPAGADAVPDHKSVESTRYRKALEALAALCGMHPDLFETLSLRLLARLEAIVSVPTPASSSASLYAHHLLSTLRAVLKTKVERGHEDVARYVEKFVPRLLGLFILPSLRSSSKVDEVATDPRLLADAASVVTIVVQRLDATRQARYAANVSTAFHTGRLDTLLGEGVKAASNEVPFSPLTNGSTTQRNLVSLYAASLIPIRPVVPLSADEDIVRGLVTRSLEAENEAQRTANVHLLGSLVNKRSPGLASFFETNAAQLWTEHIEPPTSTKRREALRAWTWIAKGLVVRSEQRGYDMVLRIVGLFGDEALGKDAARALGIVAEEDDQVLSKSNFAVIRLLYKQRFFSFLLPKLVAGHDAALGNSAVQAVHLVALSCLLNHIPKQLTLTELPKLLPLLITALDLPDPLLRANVIETLTILAQEETLSETLENSIPSIVTKLIKSLAFETGTSRDLIVRHSLSYLFLTRPEY